MLATDLEYRKVVVDNIKMGKAKMMANCAERSERILKQFLSIFSKKGLREGEILGIMLDRFGVKADVCERICKLALEKNLMYKEAAIRTPGKWVTKKMGRYILCKSN